MSKFETGTFKFNLTEFKVKELMDEINSVFVDQCKQKHIGFFCDVDEDISEIKLYSDEWKIKQVLMNTISNSFKFTFQGWISISVVKVKVDNKLYAEFWVSDTGVGIKQEDQSKLFKLFGMIADDKFNTNGTGIGLTVSKKYIENLGGHISLKSEFGQGTTVTFTIPLNTKNKDYHPSRKQRTNLWIHTTCSEYQRYEFDKLYSSSRNIDIHNTTTKAKTFTWNI